MGEIIQDPSYDDLTMIMEQIHGWSKASIQNQVS